MQAGFGEALKWRAEIICSKCIFSSGSWWWRRRNRTQAAYGRTEQNTLPLLATRGKACSVSTLIMDVLWEGKKGGAVHFTSFGWAKCKYQWEIFSSNCSWRGEEWSAGGLFIYTGRSLHFPRALASLCLSALTERVTRGGLPSKRSPCTARSTDWRVPKAKECFWCLTPLVTDALEPPLAYQVRGGLIFPFQSANELLQREVLLALLTAIPALVFLTCLRSHLFGMN